MSAVEIARRLIDGVWRTSSVTEDAGGGGGSQTLVGAHVQLNGTVSPYLGGAIPFNTVNFDSDGFWNAGTSSMTIPAGLGGLYEIQACLIAAPVSDNIVSAVGEIAIDATDWNIDPITFDLQPAPIDLAANVWRGFLNVNLPLSDDCEIYPSVYWKGDSGYGPPVPTGDLWASFFGIFRRGDTST